jgi:hypothetical protein
MAHYRLSYQETMDLPAPVFWMLNKNIDRLRAEDDVRSLQTAIAAQSGESAQKHLDALHKQMGKVVEVDEVAEAMNAEYDREGLLALKGMGSVG